jgi:hypothetical protein
MRRLCCLILLSLALAASILAQPMRVFFGNLHSHTAYSDGTGTPQDAYDYARTKGKLDFLCLSEHNHASAEGTGDDPLKLHIARDHTLYSGSRSDSLISTANRINTQFAGSFVALYGQEFSAITHGNHISVFDVGEVIDEQLIPNREFRKLYENWLVTHLDTTQKAALVQFNHPASLNEDYGILKYPDVASFVSGVQSFARTIAIISGPHDTKPGDPLRHNDNFSTNAYLHYLNLGLHLAPTADGDNHFITFGTSTDHRTAIWAPSLTKEALMDAIRNNHVYATQDKNLIVDFRVNGQIMGSTIHAAPSDALAIQVQLTDPDEPKAKYHVSLRHDTVGGPIGATNEVDRKDTTGNGMVTFDGFKYTGGVEYYLVQVVQTGAGKPDQAWTAPVWISEAPVTDEHPTTPPDHPAGFVWSVNSSVYHLAGCRDTARILDANKRTGNTPPAGKTLHANCPVQ